MSAPRNEREAYAELLRAPRTLAESRRDADYA